MRAFRPSFKQRVSPQSRTSLINLLLTPTPGEAHEQIIYSPLLFPTFWRSNNKLYGVRTSKIPHADPLHRENVVLTTFWQRSYSFVYRYTFYFGIVGCTITDTSIIFYPSLLIGFLNPSTSFDGPTLKKIKHMDPNVFQEIRGDSVQRRMGQESVPISN